MSDFPGRLRYAITNYANGALTYKGFAGLVDIPYRTLQNYISGERSPNIESLEKLHKNGININWLITGHGHPFLSRELEGPILDKIFLIFLHEIIEYAFRDGSLLNNEEKYRLLSFITGANYLGFGDALNLMFEDKKIFKNLNDMELAISSGKFREVCSPVPQNQQELWKAIQELKESRRREFNLPPHPIEDAEVGQ